MVSREDRARMTILHNSEHEGQYQWESERNKKQELKVGRANTSRVNALRICKFYIVRNGIASS